MKRRLLFVILLFSTWLYGQDSYQELDKLFNAFPADETIEANIKYSYYDELDAKQPSDTLLAFVVRRGNLFYAEMGSVEILDDGKLYIVADHESKIISLQQTTGVMPFWDLQTFQKLAEEKGLSLTGFDPGPGFDGLRFAAPHASNTVIELVYYPKTYLLHQIVMEIDVDDPYATTFNHSRLIGSFYNYKHSKTPFPYFSSTMVKKKGAQYIPIGKCEGYTIHQEPGM